MAWKSAEETHVIVKAHPDRVRLARVFGLSRLASRAVVVKGYDAPAHWTKLVPLTDYGKDFLKRVLGDATDTSNPNVLLAAFHRLYHHEFLVDPLVVDPDAMSEALEKEATSGALRWPARYGRELYDKFNDSYKGNRTDHLEPDEVDVLLAGSSPGVYQAYDILVGPLGIVRSPEVRYYLPSIDLPLWHCSDTGCRHLHRCRLRKHQSAVVQHFDRLKNDGIRLDGPRSEWGRSLTLNLRRPEDDSRGRYYSDWPAFIGNCIIGSELVTLTAMGLRGPRASAMRTLAERAKGVTRGGKPSPEIVAGKMTRHEALQLLLLMTDAELVGMLDDAVASEAIRVPPSEIRRSVHEEVGIDSMDASCELSSHGVRARVAGAHFRAWHMIRAEYKAAGAMEELAWRMRVSADRPVEYALSDFARSKGMSSVIRDLVLPSKIVATGIASRIGLDITKVSRREDQVEVFMWKLGLSPYRFDECVAVMRRRLQECRELLLTKADVRRESDREDIRGIGVNVFVSVERFIEDLVLYNTWVLNKDHFVDTRFLYRRPDASREVVSVLGEAIVSGDVEVRWLTEKGNVLGTLLVYLEAARKWIEGRVGADKEGLLRPTRDLPHYEKREGFVFRFYHTKLWADAESSAVAEVAGRFAQVSRLIQQSKSAEVRNGLDHYRDGAGFPEVEEMLACVARLEEALDIADRNRLVPKLYWVQESSHGRDGLGEGVMVDARGARVVYGSPPTVAGLPQVTYGRPYLVAPACLMGYADSPVVFVPMEETEFSRYWQGYPRQRRIPPSEEADEMR